MGFIKHTACPKCGSSDANALYSDGGSYCWSCEHTVVSEEYKQQHSKGNRKEKQKMTQQTEVEKKSKPVITQEQADEVKEDTTFAAGNYRNIRDETYKYFGVRHSVKESNGELDRQYYPVTQESTLVGYKIRELPKKFGNSIGRTGSECDLFGQFRFTKPGRYVVITEGELCQMSTYQILNDYNKEKGWDYETAVVSPTIGANCSKQIAGQYKFLDQFEKIVLCFDNDKVGKEAAEELVKVLPKGKVFMMNLRMKDANEYLKSGNEQAFLRDFWDMQKYVPAGVVGSSHLYEKLLETALVKKIPLPPFMQRLDDMLGSVELGTIGVIAAGSGAAKTTVANELLYYWLFNSPYKIGVVSLELTCGQYAQAMLSRHIENKIANIKVPEDKLKFLQQEDIKNKAEELFKTSDGGDRFMVIDERDGSIEVLQEKIEEMVISCGVKVIVLDPISDLFDGLPLDQQANLMKWQKSIVKNYNVTFINIAHIRKGSNNKEAASSGAFVPEEAVIGASQQVKSASWVIMLQRDKYHESDIIRNVTHITLTKNRSNGVTGKAGSMYYSNDTHRLYDFDSWANENGITDVNF